MRVPLRGDPLRGTEPRVRGQPLTAMKVDTFETLLADLCREVGIDAARLGGEGRLVVDGTEISLAHDVDPEGEHIWICIDFGAIPQRHAGRVYRAMLQSNLRAGGLEVGVFTLQSDGRAALVVRRPLTQAFTGRQLATALLQYAAAARGWMARACGKA